MRSSRAVPVGLFVITLTGCAAAPLRRFPVREPLLEDDDTHPWRSACGPDVHRPEKTTCLPPEYVSSFVWDGADAMIFHPVSRFLAVSPAGESVNVNALDEVPDSSWFQNRLSRHPLSADEIAAGACTGAPPNTEETWTIDAGKANGANPGFRVTTASGEKYLLKVDERGHPERATGADAIATRMYHAAGYWTGCDRVVYARRDILKLQPNLHYADNSGIQRPFGQKELDEILDGAARRGDTYRFIASKWLEGKPLGPFTYEGVRKDDPNDVVPHEDRRELRGQRVLAAWLGHFDAREQNSMTTWLTRRESDAESAPGHIRHWIMDLNDCFGSEWKWDKVTRRIGHSYYFDGKDIAFDYLSLGIPQRPWDRAKRPKDGEIFGYYDADLFEPEDWKPGYQNPAFLRMSELDAAWMARIIARFTPEHIERLVKMGDFTQPKHAEYLRRTLIGRQQKILRRYFSIASPIADLEVHGSELCAVDLANMANPSERFRYSARASGHPLLVTVHPSGRICVPIPKNDYVVIELDNGVAEHPLAAHLAGTRLVGIER